MKNVNRQSFTMSSLILLRNFFIRTNSNRPSRSILIEAATLALL